MSVSGRWQQFILHLMGKEDPPERIAAAFALGVAISFFTPLTGFHTLIALGLAFLLGLSKVDVIMGTLVVNPWTVVPVITFEQFVGKKMLRYSPSLAPRLPWRQILHRQFWQHLGKRMDLPRVLDRRFPRLLGGRGDDHLLLRPRGHLATRKCIRISARLRRTCETAVRQRGGRTESNLGRSTSDERPPSASVRSGRRQKRDVAA